MKMRRCEDEKLFYRPPLLEEPCAQTLSGKNILNAFRPSDSEVKQNIRDAVNMAHDYTEETQMLLEKIKMRKITKNMLITYIHT